MNVESIAASATSNQLQLKPVEVSFESVLRKIEVQVQPTSVEAGQRNLFGSSRAMLDNLIADQRRIDASSRSHHIEKASVVGDGQAPEAFSAATGQNTLASAQQAATSLIDLTLHMFRIQIVHKGVSGLNKVWENLSKGQ
jgi:hypothetical protein